MNAMGGGGAIRHPGYVAIPDPKTAEGVRNYRESEQPHPLQLTFLTEEGERDYIERLRTLLTDGQVAEADRILTADLSMFDGSLARICRATPPEAVTIDGWEDLLPILEEFEGPPITAITIGLTNEPDLVFEGGKLHEPAVMLGLYSDEAFDFTRATREALLDECASDMPGWAGHEEDVEFYVDCAGLAELNTALIQCKHRYFLRDGRDGVSGRAPGGYVEYVLGCWLRATRFLQALERVAAGHGLPEGARLVAGTVGLHTDLATVIENGRHVAVDRGAATVPTPLATLTMKRWVPREDPTIETLSSGSALRQKVAAVPEAETPSVAAPAEAAPVAAAAAGVPPPTQDTPPTYVPEAQDAPAPKAGFFARLFGRRRGQ